MRIRIFAMILLGAMLMAFSAGCADPGETDTELSDYVFNEDGVLEINAYNEYNLEEYVTLGTYLEVMVNSKDPSPTQEEIDAYIRNVLNQNGKLVAVTERPVQKGDTVGISYEGTMDNMETPSGLTTNGSVTSLVIGSGNYIDGFEEGLIGAALGDTVELHLNFPDPYPNNTDLSGQPVTFKVTVASISETQLPEYNDYFVATVSDYATVEEYEASVALQLYTKNAEAVRNEQINTIWDTITSTSTIHQYPQPEIDRYKADMIAYYNEYATYSGYESLEAMLSGLYGIDMVTFEADLQDYAEAAILEEMILFSIIKKEGITLTTEEYDEGAIAYAQLYGVSDVATLETEYGRDTVIQSLLWDKTVEYLLDNAMKINYNTIAGGETAADQ